MRPAPPIAALAASLAVLASPAAHAQGALESLVQELQKSWYPRCELEGARDLRIRVGFMIGPDGLISGAPDVGGLESSPDPATRAAAESAILAVTRTAQRVRLPEEFYGRRLNVTFNSRDVCS